MDRDLFEYKMKQAGYRTAKQRANAIGVSLSAYYKRIKNKCECNQQEIGKTAEILGWEVAKQIFFAN